MFWGHEWSEHNIIVSRVNDAILSPFPAIADIKKSSTKTRTWKSVFGLFVFRALKHLTGSPPCKNYAKFVPNANCSERNGRIKRTTHVCVVHEMQRQRKQQQSHAEKDNCLLHALSFDRSLLLSCQPPFWETSTAPNCGQPKIFYNCHVNLLKSGLGFAGVPQIPYTEIALNAFQTKWITVGIKNDQRSKATPCRNTYFIWRFPSEIDNWSISHSHNKSFYWTISNP